LKAARSVVLWTVVAFAAGCGGRLAVEYRATAMMAASEARRHGLHTMRFAFSKAMSAIRSMTRSRSKSPILPIPGGA